MTQPAGDVSVATRAGPCAATTVARAERVEEPRALRRRRRGEKSGCTVVGNRIQPLVQRGGEARRRRGGGQRSIEAASPQFPRGDAEYVESPGAGGQSVSSRGAGGGEGELAGLLGAFSRAASAAPSRGENTARDVTAIAPQLVATISWLVANPQPCVIN